MRAQIQSVVLPAEHNIRAGKQKRSGKEVGRSQSCICLTRKSKQEKQHSPGYSTLRVPATIGIQLRSNQSTSACKVLHLAVVLMSKYGNKNRCVGGEQWNVWLTGKTTIMSTSYILYTNAHYLQDQMTGRPFLPVLTEILDLPESCPDKKKKKKTNKRERKGKWRETQEEKWREYSN